MSAGKRRLNIVGPQIRRLRYGMGWTQKTLAAKLQIAGLDMSRSTVAKVEAGLASIADFKLVYFAHVLQVEIQDLFPAIHVHDPDLCQMVDTHLNRRY